MAFSYLVAFGRQGSARRRKPLGAAGQSRVRRPARWVRGVKAPSGTADTGSRAYIRPSRDRWGWAEHAEHFNDVIAGCRRSRCGRRQWESGSSTSSGSADVIEELGVRLDLAPANVVRTADRAEITFCFAQTFHSSMKNRAVPSRELGVPTAFNFLVPLSQPRWSYSSSGGVRRSTHGAVDGRCAGRQERSRPCRSRQADNWWNVNRLGGGVTAW